MRLCPWVRVSFWFTFCGLAAGLAAIVYVAHLGQAKSDAGTGYELIAITAVVLGGTSIFGGSGTILGTLMGLAAIVVLQNGLRLSAWPTEVAGISTGTLLIANDCDRALGEQRGRAKQVPHAMERRRRSAALARDRILSSAAPGKAKLTAMPRANESRWQ